MNWESLLCSDRIRMVAKGASSSDERTEFEKDYQRIISSASFRRLQDKTQVFPLDKSDFIRTRLTHSLEVANFARSIGKMIGSRIISEGKDPGFTDKMREDVASILECAGLLHDIGNPPFGHFGEDAIRDWFKNNLPLMEFRGRKISEILSDRQREDFYNFEGNTQALRVVTKLHFLVDEHGMNLTKALLATIMKYPVSSVQIKQDPHDITCKKMGYFAADTEVFEDVQKSCGTNGRRHPLAFALEAADDIAYRTADIEDAVKKGLLDIHILIREMEKLSDEAVKNKVPREQTETCKKYISKLEHYYEKALDQGYEEPQLYAVQNLVVRIQGLLLACAVDSFMSNYDAIMTGSYKKELLADTPGSLLLEILGDVALRYAFLSAPILKLEVAADAIFDFLLGHIVRALVYYDTDEWKMHRCAVDTKMIGLISPSFMQVYRIYSKDASDEEKLYLRLLLSTDYVSGMTDGYAKRLYRELLGMDTSLNV
ncbi:MAG: deoxyguanosinetriphosphate triphosphohydrolase [Lachnospiraceae bacterium]|nr:deoxyguanosinetriphosphate triphosphohydrolase [Lachnospiraceae bacterium]